jgi:oligosaccharide repeat unit polymerase
MTMTITGVYLFIFWIAATCAALAIIRDLAAPQLMFCAALGVFFSDIFVTEYDIYVYGIYVISLLVVLASCVYNRDGLYLSSQRSPGKSVKLNNDDHSKQDNIDIRSGLLWIASIPAIISMVYMVYIFGGFASYLIAAKHGTKYFYGLGPLKVLITTFYPISLYYFALLISRRRSRKEYAMFYGHFVLVLVLALLSLSRGTLLTHFVAMGLIWHYSRQRFSPVFIVLGLVSVLSAASIYGVVRESVSYNEGIFSLGLDTDAGVSGSSGGKVYKKEWMHAGTWPLKTVLDAPSVEKHWGLTYATAVTNFVPRSIWPGKPDPGGVVFTNEYASGFYDEYSHFASGLYPEAIMNFGKPFGIMFGVIQLAAMCLLLSYYYKRTLYKLQCTAKTRKSLLGLVIYIYIVWGSVILLSGEFTSVVIGVVIKIIVLVSVYHFTRLRMWPARKLTRSLS